MSNIEYVYTLDPKKNPRAKKIKKTTWKNFSKIVGTKWQPGLNVPFDPIAAKEANKLNLTVHIIGPDLKNLRRLLDGKPFTGTTIK